MCCLRLLPNPSDGMVAEGSAWRGQAGSFCGACLDERSLEISALICSGLSPPSRKGLGKANWSKFWGGKNSDSDSNGSSEWYTVVWHGGLL